MKIKIVLSVSVSLLWTEQASAQFSKPNRQPTAASTQSLREQPTPEERAHVPGEPERVEAQARMETLYRRLDADADRAARSICDGCGQGPAAGAKYQRLESSAGKPERLVDDPAQAPRY
ncbi:hypothetical protein [Methylorubrum aminovorans]|uniref:hypothetical protein n=1 Tax=Methylorubrum aminovorans TaxID=269069 RepID=UPI001EDE16A7|nr:hypothetical protein [Methylorubrum aminovorans]GMA74189.1 hypothetical protein GCM10025880_06060 [Methylorubrum aminovorans]